MEELDLGQTIRGFGAGQKVFGRYVLQSILGRGGMGIVWRAYDEQLECEVALKFLPEMVAFDEQAIADLKRETKKTRDLRHHHIVQVYDFVTDKHAACISMEYVDGLTLSAIKARDPRGHLEVEDISTWVEQLCEALSYAHHRARVVHRDLKPANLMLTSRGELKVTDFGIARSLSDSVSMLTMARGTSGTLLYMSPQQLDGERASHLDDIYSLGATIYELLTGRPPFYSGAVERQVHEKTAPAISQRREDLDISGAKEVPASWEQMIAACLAKDPAQRPQSAGEVARCLGVEHLSRPVVEEKAGPSSSPPQAATTRKLTQPVALPLSPPIERPANRKIVLATALVILLVVAALGGWWFGVAQPLRKTERERQAAAVAETPRNEKDKAQSEAASRSAIEERERLEREKKTTAEAEATKERLATAEKEDPAPNRSPARGFSDLDSLLAQKGPLGSGTQMRLPDDQLFSYDSADLQPSAMSQLQKLGTLIQRNRMAIFAIEGYTDSLGSPEYNLDLSQRRADAVKQYLVEAMGINPAQITARGYGASKFIVPPRPDTYAYNSPEEQMEIERQRPNRRVVIVVR